MSVQRMIAKNSVFYRLLVAQWPTNHIKNHTGCVHMAGIESDFFSIPIFFLGLIAHTVIVQTRIFQKCTLKPHPKCCNITLFYKNLILSELWRFRLQIIQILVGSVNKAVNYCNPFPQTTIQYTVCLKRRKVGSQKKTESYSQCGCVSITVFFA